jgi:hypothetical protein
LYPLNMYAYLTNYVKQGVSKKIKKLKNQEN